MTTKQLADDVRYLTREITDELAAVAAGTRRPDPGHLDYLVDTRDRQARLLELRAVAAEVSL